MLLLFKISNIFIYTHAYMSTNKTFFGNNFK